MLALYGAVWTGGDAAVVPDGTVLVADGMVTYAGPALPVPHGAEVVRGVWVGPGVVDAHVHLAFGTFEEGLRGGVVAVRDLGAPLDLARRWRGPNVAVAGPLLTAPGGYPSRSWGSAGFAEFVASPEEARAAVRTLSGDVDVVKVALEPAGGAPVPSLDVVRAVVDAAHGHGLAVTAHALTEDMVGRALDAGVDELCHTPVEPLSAGTVQRIATAGIPVVSTIETLGAGAIANAATLHAAGVRLVYGTDLGNAGTRPGVDSRELDRLAEAGLGALGALRAATGVIEVGAPADVVVLAADPLATSGAWHAPVAVISRGRRVSGAGE